MMKFLFLAFVFVVTAFAAEDNQYASPNIPENTGVSLTEQEVWFTLSAISAEHQKAVSEWIENHNGSDPDPHTLDVFATTASLKTKNYLARAFPNAQTQAAFSNDFVETPPASFGALASPVRLALVREMSVKTLADYRKRHGPDLEEVSPLEDPRLGREARRDIVAIEFQKSLDSWMKNRPSLRALRPKTAVSLAGIGLSWAYLTALAKIPAMQEFFISNPTLATSMLFVTFAGPHAATATLTTAFNWKHASAALDALEASAGSKIFTQHERMALLKASEAERKLWWSLNFRCSRILRILHNNVIASP